jgi:hypothetical protein
MSCRQIAEIFPIRFDSQIRHIKVDFVQFFFWAALNSLKSVIKNGLSGFRLSLCIEQPHEIEQSVKCYAQQNYQPSVS